MLCRVVFLCASLIALPVTSAAASAIDENQVVVASLVAEAPQAIKALVMAAALFCANVGVIGVGAFLLGASADWMAAAEVAAPMTRALLGADLLLLPAILVYLALHRSVTVAGAE